LDNSNSKIDEEVNNELGEESKANSNNEEVKSEIDVIEQRQSGDSSSSSPDGLSRKKGEKQKVLVEEEDKEELK